ncbi:MAG: discoidin domain-containing protein [Sedimentisphaerales bacterium]|nr:discoidin domain-containing protein [Sedimentisphaerales bacterium]
MRKRLMYLIPCLVVVGSMLASTASADVAAWWKFDETEGTVAADSSGNGYDGALVNGGTWTAGYDKGALQLDGNNDYVNLPIGALIPTLQECTFAIWVNWSGEGGAWQRFLDIGTGEANYIYFCPGDGGNALRVAIVAGNGIWNEIIYSEGLPNDGWHHIAVTVSESEATMRLYLDAELVDTYPDMVNSVDDLGQTTQNWVGRSQYGADPYFDGLVDDLQIHNVVLSADEIRRVMLGLTDSSSRPRPADGAVDVRRDTVLTWNPGLLAATHDVYFGTAFDDVNSASRTDPRGVLVSQNQTANTYDPPGMLAIGQTYYWRVDDVNAAIATTLKGEIWSFTAEPYAYLVTNVTATATIPTEAGSDIANIVNGSGVREDGGHTIVPQDIWKGTGKSTDDVTIQFAFDRLYKLDEMRVWNYNHQYEPYLFFSLKDITVEYSADGETWTTLGDYTLPQGTGQITFQALPIDFGGAPARYVRFVVNSNYGGGGFGLSEVQFYQIPTFAREPQPQAGAVDVSPSVVLSWRPGREAASHEVHISTDANAVAAGEALADTVSVPSYDATPVNLLMGEKYYWMIVEVNDAETPSAWDSDVWDFNTPGFIVVDDFESYTEEDGNLIYEAWGDGYGVAGNGSQVGHNDPPYVELNNVLPGSGAQAMPFTYGLDSETTSEATRTFASPQDWTRGGASTLVVWFRGNLGNATGQLYLKVNGTRINYSGSAGSLAASVWKQWNVDLASLGAAAKSVKTLTLGVSGSGTGMLYFDEIRLYRDAPPATGNPVDPGMANLVAHYPMSDSAADASGNNRNGTVETGSSFAAGPQGYGRAVVLDGTSGYVTLPIGMLIQSLSSSTYASWVNFLAPTGGAWERVFDFGTGTTNYMFLSTRQTATGPMTFGILTTGGTEVRVVGPDRVPAGWHHVAVVIDSATMNIDLYLDGLVVGSNTTTMLPSGLGNTTQNWLGRSQWADDSYYAGSIDEFRIYNRALTSAEVQYLAGDR